jgi:cobalt-zinc-cadmium efflux system membrane fusion protein
MVFISCKPTGGEKLHQQEVSINDGQVQLTEAQFNNADIMIGNPETVKIDQMVRLNGKTEVMPEHIVSVNSPMAGFIRSIKWMPGMSVSKGQTLVRMEDRDYIQLQQDYLSAKSAFGYAQKDYQRQYELSKSQAASEKVLQQAEEKMKQFEIDVKSLSEKLKLIHINPSLLTPEKISSEINIPAPVSGSITTVFANVGKYIQAGDEIIKMISSADIRIVLKAFEKDLPLLSPDHKISVFSNADPNRKYSGRIAYIVKNIRPEGFADVICTLDQIPPDFIPGLYITASIAATSLDAVTLPSDAIVNFEGKEYVFAEVSTRTYQMIEVQSGQKENGKTQIINSQELAEKQIVTKGAYTLLMKMKNVAE